MKIPIRNKFIISDDYSSDMNLAYIGMRIIMCTTKCVDKKYVNYIDSSLIYFNLADKILTRRYVRSKIQNGIYSLINNKYIGQIDVNTEDVYPSWVCDLHKLYIDTSRGDVDSYYSLVDTEHISKIVQCGYKEYAKLLHFYCYLTTTFQNSGYSMGVGFTSYVNLSDTIGYTEKTVSKYMKKLVEMGIIYIYSPNKALFDKETKALREISAAYGFLENKDKVIQCGKEYESRYGEDIKIPSPKRSSTRSASMKYNRIMQDIQNINKYSYDEIKEIYTTLLSYYEENKDNPNVKVKDLSIFSNYDFYNKAT